MAMDQIMVKVYGSVTPADDAMLQAVSAVAPDAVSLSGDTLLLSHEGIFFMLDDFLTALRPHLGPASSGRIDYIDMDEWTLTRHWIDNGLLTSNTASLNQVMEYSGH